MNDTKAMMIPCEDCRVLINPLNSKSHMVNRFSFCKKQKILPIFLILKQCAISKKYESQEKAKYEEISRGKQPFVSSGFIMIFVTQNEFM
jgi:hypothetical protein